MDQKSTITDVLQQVATACERHTDQIMQEKIGIGLAQFKILQQLHEYPAIRQAQIATTLNQTEASVSRQIKLLLEKGLLTSRVNTKNRREHIHVLTPRGQKMTLAAAETLQHYIDALFATMGDKQQKQLYEALISLQSNVR
jgi:DNA-binding MarR family transcriptional regulator